MDHLTTLGVVAGLLAIDDRAGWQSLLAQPVFTALLVGLVVGDLTTALAVGVVLELIWLSILPMRGQRRPDQIAGAVVGAGTACGLTTLTADPRVGFIVAIGIFVGLIAGELGERITLPLWRLRDRTLAESDFAKQQSDLTRRLFLAHTGSLGFIFVVEAVLVVLLLQLAYRFGDLIARSIDGTLVVGAVTWRYLLPALGAASLIHLFWHRHLKRVLILSAVMVTLVLWLR